MRRRHETPLRRVNPSGQVVWAARFTDATGRRRSAGTFDLKRDAQRAIDDAYDNDGAVGGSPLVGAYAEREWLQRHPRTTRTTVSYEQRLRAMLDVKVENRRVRDWPLTEFRRRQAGQLLDVLLREQKRAAKGAKGMLLVMSAMYSDAAEDGLVEHNPFIGMRVRQADPRVVKAPRRTIVASWEEMHTFAAACGQWETMVRVLSDCGLRLGELFPLERADLVDGEDGPWLRVQRTAWRGAVQAGTKTDHGSADPGRRVPVPPALHELLLAVPRRIDTRLMFPGPRGVWRDRRFYDLVWYPAQKATGLELKPHDMRHSYVSLMRAAGVDPAALASWTGHSVLTATSVYTHATGSVETAASGRSAVG